jgi:hypothetical protein
MIGFDVDRDVLAEIAQRDRRCGIGEALGQCRQRVEIVVMRHLPPSPHYGGERPAKPLRRGRRGDQDRASREDAMRARRCALRPRC